jgi:hypothetical protein
MILRALLGLGAALSLVYFFGAARRRPAQKLGVSLTFGSIALFALFPDASHEVARWFGVGRGVDFVLYLSSFTLLGLTFSLYLGQRDLSDALTSLARADALKGACANEQDVSLGEPLPQPLVWVVVPIYNEEEVIEGVLSELIEAGYAVIAVDDGSPDRSAERVAALPVHLIKHPINLGQGAALQTGFDYALQQGAEVVVTFDADGQHRVEDIARLLSALEAEAEPSARVEAALGSRFLEGAGAEGMPWRRALLLRGAVLFTRWVGGVEVSDSHNGLRALRASALRRVRLTQPRMAHASELLHELKRQEVRFVEVAVRVRYTERSLAKGQRALGALNILFDLWVRRWFG